MTFEQMNLSISMQKTLTSMGFNEPTPVQAQAIPLAIAGKDLIACAQTGTGKTGAFGIPMVTKLATNPQMNALILAPTRELALQIELVLQKLTQGESQMNISTLIGGTSMKAQFRTLGNRPRIIIATPGRLIDHLKRRSLQISNVGILVLDEADRMLDMGFAPQLKEILTYLPKQRQTLLFSATLPHNIQQLSSQYLKDPERVTVGAISKPIEKINQVVIETTQNGKRDLILDQLNARPGSVLIFTRTKTRADRLSQFLNDYGFSVTRIHGDRSQAQRENAIAGFRTGTFRILVATDIAARGLDIPHIAHVINYDLPQAPEDYVHRIGRTARAGAQGEALCMITPEDRSLWMRISRLCKLDAGLAGAAGSDEGTEAPRQRQPKRKSPSGDRSYKPKKSLNRRFAEKRAHSAGSSGGGGAKKSGVRKHKDRRNERTSRH